MDLSNKLYIITGAYQGLGKSLANLLEEKGASVIRCYHNKVIDNGYKCDVTCEEEVKKLFSLYPNISGVINCATLSIDNDYHDKSIDEFMDVVKVNLGGTYLINKYAALNMNDGVVVNISSTDGDDTYSSYSMDYSAAKAGVINLTKNFSITDLNNKYLCLVPGWIDTEEVLKMDKHYLEEEMLKHGQKELLKKENVALKIMDLLTNDNYKSGDIIRMDGINE